MRASLLVPLLSACIVAGALLGCDDGPDSCDLDADGVCPVGCPTDPDCGGDAGPACDPGDADCGVDADAPRNLFVDIQYATRCDMTLGCSGLSERDICGIAGGDTCIEGTDPVSASCMVTDDGGTRTLDFSASQGPTFSIAVSGATFAASGGGASGTCTVTIEEGPNLYEGACGSSEPSEAQPCQIDSVSFFDDEGNPTVEGGIFCQFLPNRANPDLEIEVTAFGSGPAAAMTPGRFRIANCEGLEI